jgi:hypothetical protein
MARILGAALSAANVIMCLLLLLILVLVLALVIVIVIEIQRTQIDHEQEHDYDKERNVPRGETICDFGWPGYFSGPRTPDGAAAICTPGPAKRDRISE